MPISNTADDIAKQVITTVSTLVVAVAGFYFGSKAVSSRPQGEVPISAPVIQTINPTSGVRGKVVLFEITGMGLELAKEVKLVKNKCEIPCTSVLSRSDAISCKCSIPIDVNEYPTGKYTVVVTNSDTGQGMLEEGFEIQ